MGGIVPISLHEMMSLMVGFVMEEQIKVGYLFRENFLAFNKSNKTAINYNIFLK